MTADKARKRSVREIAATNGRSFTAANRLAVEPGRCPRDGCVSEEIVQRHDGGDGAPDRCDCCGYPVCFYCGRNPIRDVSEGMCVPCSKAAAPDR
jgi:hypothetical protein